MLLPGRIFTPDPVSDHPLNDGLVPWWLGLPELSGGPNLFDLRGRTKGTLGTTVAWAAGPNGFGAVDHDGTITTSRVTYSNVVLGTTQRMTFASWALLRTQTAYSPILETRTGSQFIGLLKRGNSAIAPTLTASWNNTSAEYNTGPSPSLPITLNEWTFCAATINGTTTTVYRWSPSQGFGSGTITITATDRTVTGDWYTGYDVAGILNGRTSNQRIWFDRVLSDSDVLAVLDQDLRGCPDLLRRIRPWSFGVEAGGGDTTILLSALTGAGTIVSPVLTSGQQITLSPIESEGVLTDPTAQVVSELAVPSIGSTGTLTSLTATTSIAVSIDALSVSTTLVSLEASASGGAQLPALIGYGSFTTSVVVVGTEIPLPALLGGGTLIPPLIQVASAITLATLLGEGTAIPPQAVIDSGFQLPVIAIEGSLQDLILDVGNLVQLDPLEGQGELTGLVVLTNINVTLSSLLAHGLIANPEVETLYDTIISLQPLLGQALLIPIQIKLSGAGGVTGRLSLVPIVTGKLSLVPLVSGVPRL